MCRVILIVSILLAGLALAEQPKVHSKKAKHEAASEFGNSDSLTELELKVHEYVLASDQLEGRNLPSRGYDTAALYVASQLAQWGLTPGGSTSGTNGPLQRYFMPFELVAKLAVPGESKATVTGRGKSADTGAQADKANALKPATTDFLYGRDWAVIPGRGAPPLDAFDVAGDVVFAGNGWVIQKTKVDPFEGLDVKGKIVVVAGLPSEMQAMQARVRAGGEGGGNPLGEDCTDYLTPEEAAAKNGALAVVKIVSFQQLVAANAAGGGGGFTGIPFSAGTVGRTPGPNGLTYRVAKFPSSLLCPAVPSVTVGPSMTNRIFEGEKQDGEKIFSLAGQGGRQDSFALTTDKKISLHVAVKSETGHAENVVGIIPGSDPQKKGEYVVMSAHLDHIGLSAPASGGDNINNGADDDASGSTALLAIARAYAEGAAKGIAPRRSILFLWNGGEEKGLWGSQYFAEFPPIDISKIVANLNIDMIGRTKGQGFVDTNAAHVLVNPGEIMLVGPHVSSTDLEKTIEATNAGYQKLVLNHFYDTTAPDNTHDNLGPSPRGQRIFYRSDHYNFAKVGVPIVFFTTGLHPDYHKPTDSPDKLDYKEMLAVSKTVSAIGWVLANQEGRPQLNAVLPEQLMKDMKLAKDQGWGQLTPVLAPLPDEPF